MHASGQYLQDALRTPDLSALLQVASLVGVKVTGVRRGVPADAPSPILFAVIPWRAHDHKAASVPLDHDAREAAGTARLEYDTRSWFVAYSPGQVFPGGYIAYPKSGLLFVAGPAGLLRACTATLRLLTVSEIQNIRTRGACSQAVRLKHQLKSGGYGGAIRDELQTFCANCSALHLLAAMPNVDDKAAANRVLDQVLKHCKEL